MQIQLIDRKRLIFRIENVEYCFVKPYYLMKGIVLIKGLVKGSTLCWNVERGVITYNQIKKAVKSVKET